MTDPLGAWQTALYGALSPVVGVPIYDYVPEGAAMPYVVIGDAWTVPADVHGLGGFTVSGDVHVWSRQRGFAEATDIAALVLGVLNHQRLDVDGFGQVDVAVTGTQAMRDPDPEIRHVPVTYRAMWLLPVP